ncbi:hypothetical protein FACS1894191_3420 [Clostridia bacterium]|nr:hypothetical protein FACS1894191_3420 [Clostridia bacterium]
MPKNAKAAAITATTKHKIGKTTYLVTASPSEKATDTIERKIEKLIMRDVQKTAEYSRFEKKTG